MGRETHVILLEQGDVAIGIVRQFPFESQLQRASVVITPAGSNRFQVYAKGAPETIIRMCAEESGMFHFLLRSDLEEHNIKKVSALSLHVLCLANDLKPLRCRMCTLAN